MSPETLKKFTVTRLLFELKKSAVCPYSQKQAKSIYKELEQRLGSDMLQDIKTTWYNMEAGDTDAEFVYEVNLLIDNYATQKTEENKPSKLRLKARSIIKKFRNLHK